MQVLSPLTPWKWTQTDQQAFEEVKEQVNQWRNLRRKAIGYLPGAEWVNLCCDVCLTGGSGVISQGIYYDQIVGLLLVDT